MFAIASGLIAFLLYLSISHFKGRIDDGPSKVPALAFVLLFFIVACWVLGFLTFFFDQYRVPLLTCLVLLSLATSFVPQSDHIYQVHEFNRQPMKQPYQVVKERADHGKRRLILVSAAGGGIQAAAWTAQVLVGLEQECANQAAAGKSCDFRNSVALISSVSGGSLGALSYARSYATQPCGVPTEEVVDRSAKSAIDEVAWAWVNPDVARAVVPWFRRQYIDRGWALEERWAAANELRQCGPSPTKLPDCHLVNDQQACTQKETFLSDWGSLPNNMPALLLNSTVVETGQPLVFSTTDFPRGEQPGGLRNFYELYPELGGKDISVDTAARLSASFPYVAPAARSNVVSDNLPDLHLVDGGYYDNFGMTSLLAWLHDAIENIPPADRREVADDLSTC